MVIDGDKLIIVEAKASPPKEPMRDASRGFIRIRDHFRSNSGVQKAYNQAISLKKKLDVDVTVPLYDKKGQLITSLNKDSFKEIYIICVTRDSFGSLACNLNFLLEKDENEPYPWVIDIANFENMVDVWEYFDELSQIDFYKFLKQRQQLYGKVISNDELEFVGGFLKYHEGLQGFIDAEADMVIMHLSESHIFDDVFFAKQSNEKIELQKELLDLSSMDNKLVSNINKSSSKNTLSRKKLRKSKRKMINKSQKKNRRK